MTAAAQKKPIEFRKSKNNIFRHWLTCQGHACEIDGVALSLNKAPPPLAHPAPQAAAATTEVREKPDLRPQARSGLAKLMQAQRDFVEWLESPPPPPAPPAPPPTPASRVPVFDIQDVPKAMDKLAMPVSAKLQRRWFAGYENYSRSAEDQRNEIDQNGARYARAMVDDTTIKMEWVLRFPRAREALEELIQHEVRTKKAIGTLRDILRPHSRYSHLHAWREAGEDFFKFHKTFQFQVKAVNSTWGQRIGSFLDRSFTAGGVPDDLTGALGSFNFFAAVDFATFDRQRNEAVVSHLWVYVRDSYDFIDDQYLGHWSANHVAVVPAHHMAGGKDWLRYPVVHGDVNIKNSVLYPVTNKDYRDWRARHKQGGDFMIYSDRYPVRLNPYIRVPLQEPL